jgi:ectoine hydroxylase-related dioxygenase (phytanoyl-CoA dioxygenase family)
MPLMPTAHSPVEEFQRNGFVRLAEFVPPLVVARAHRAVPEVVAAAERAFGRCRDCGGVHHDFDERDCGNLTRPFVQLFNAWAHSPAFRELVFHPALSRAARALLGCDAVRLIHDQLLIKRPGDEPTSAHIDGHTWPFDGRACTFWIPLTDVSAEMGTLLFYRGSHRRDISRALLETVEEEEAARAVARWVADEGPEPEGFELRRGEATAHDKWMVHSTAANASDETRAVLSVHVMDAAARRGAARGPMQQAHVELFHWQGIPAGAELSAAVCPVL